MKFILINPDDFVRFIFKQISTKAFFLNGRNHANRDSLNSGRESPSFIARFAYFAVRSLSDSHDLPTISSCSGVRLNRIGGRISVNLS